MLLIVLYVTLGDISDIYTRLRGDLANCRAFSLQSSSRFLSARQSTHIPHPRDRTPPWLNGVGKYDLKMAAYK